MPHRRSTVKGSLSFANPTVRAWLFQILAVVAAVSIVGWLFHNTVTNLSNRGITSGFAFLDRGAGFGIVQHLIDYQQGDTYGRIFIVGLLNTLLVSALCIVFASVWASLSVWRDFRITGCYESFPQFILRSSVIFPRCCKSSSGTLPCCAICPDHDRQ